MKKILYIFITVLALAIAGFFFSHNVKAIESYFTRVTTTASTTVSYMVQATNTATSTIIARTWNIDKTDLWIQFTASTSAATLNWQYSFSNGVQCDTNPNGCDWFYEDIPSYIYPTSLVSLVNIEHASTTITHRWNPGSTSASTTRKVLTLPDIASNWKRVDFFLSASSTQSTRGSLWIDETIKSNTQ